MIGWQSREAICLSFSTPVSTAGNRNIIDSKVPYFHHYSLINMAVGGYGVFNVNHLVHRVAVHVVSIKGPYCHR